MPSYIYVFIHQSSLHMNSTSKCIHVLGFILIFLSTSLAQNRPPYYDGPYIFDQGDSLRIQYVLSGYGYDTLITKADAGIWAADSIPAVDLLDLSYHTPTQYTYDKVKKVAVLSDIHGQYDIMISLLRTHGVIDETGK